MSQELIRRLDDHQERIQRLETRSAVDEVHRSNVENRLDSIEGTLKWLVRLIFGALILLLVEFALGGGLVVPG